MDHYNTLGISKDATQDEIKKAFRSLASKHHPDKGGDTASFQKIQEAYATLGDPEKRAAYDNPSPFGQDPFGSWQQANAGGVPPGFEQFFHQFGPDLGGLFGRRMQRNKNINLETVISLEEAFAGKEIIASYRVGNYQERTFEVKIPAGINDGVTLRIAGAGDNSFVGVPAGDAMLTVRVSPHKRFQRNGNDLVEQITISAWDAMLGKDLEVKTINGDNLTVRIKEGTQPDSFLRIQGYGMPAMNNPGVKGHHMILVKVSIPNDLTEYQKNTIRSITS
jgi:DnaJ-class molecular chaperone